MTGRRNAQRGWMLLQMTYVLVLLAVFAAMAGELFSTVFMVRREAELRERQCVQWTLIVDKLHRDAWGAASWETPDPHTLRLILPDDSVITWRVGTDGSIRSEHLAWPELGEGVTFDAKGVAAEMHVDRLPIRSGGEYWFTSQLRLAEAMR